jgi:hypothetical protein
MRSLRAFLSVARMDAGKTAGRTVGKYLRYIHFRDSIQRGDEGSGLGGLVRYVAHRERISPDGRLFTTDRTVRDPERRALAAYISRSVRDIAGRPGRPQTAAYRFVLSPEDAHGLDLRGLTREVMLQLERDAGSRLFWIAAEHRNTAHPHVHILLAARLEREPGTFHGAKITRERLARLKLTMGREIRRQRGALELGVELGTSPARSAGPPGRSMTPDHRRHRPRSRTMQIQTPNTDPLRWRERRPRQRVRRGLGWYPLGRALGRLAYRYRLHVEREEREEMRRRARSERTSWEREWEAYE